MEFWNVMQAQRWLQAAEEPPAFDPEDGLTLTSSSPETTTMTATLLNVTQPGVFAVDFTGLDGSAGGAIFELGGSGSGSYVGFRADGTFVARAGSGTTPGTSTVAILEIPAVSAPSGDGTLVWEFSGPGSAVAVRAWWNGTLLGAHTSTHTGSWAGSDTGGFLRYNPALSGNGYGAMLTGEYYNADAVRVSNSDLRYYQNQTVA